MLTIIPWYYRALILAALAVAVAGFGWIKGAAHVQARWQAEQLAQAVATSEQQARQAQATVEVVTVYVDRIQTVQAKTKTIIKEIPVYVTKEADADCTINRGFVRLHDAAATAADLPNPAGPADAGASGIALSTVAATVTTNYGLCHETAEQLTALQEWITAMAAK